MIEAEPKKLYVVSSLHYGPDPEENEQNEAAITTRLRLIEALAKTIKVGGYFCDSLTEGMDDDLNEMLEFSLDDVALVTEHARSTNDSASYEAFRQAQILRRLREDGCVFRFKKTEDLIWTEDIMDKYKLADEPAIAKIVKNYNQSQQEMANAMAEHVERRALEIRDAEIVRNVEGLGEDENILYVGSAHKLPTLVGSSLEFYRLWIDQTMGQIGIYGVIPERFRTELEKLPTRTKDGKPIVRPIQYVKESV